MTVNKNLKDQIYIGLFILFVGFLTQLGLTLAYDVPDEHHKVFTQGKSF